MTIRNSVLMAAFLAASAAAQTPADFYDESVIQDVYLEIHPKDWAKLQENYWDNTYYPANFQWRGILIENVGVRSRGRGSRSPVKPNLKIDFDRYEGDQKFLGLKSTTLKANNQDSSMIKERVSMLLFDQMGIPTPKEAYMRLYLNGEYFGLYNLIETIDKSFLRRVFGEDEGYLYEWKPKGEAPGYHFEYLGPEPELYSPVHFDPVTHEKDPDPTPLVEMIRAINESSGEEFLNAISQYIDAKRFLTHVAVEAYMAEFDGILGDVFGMNNFQVYRSSGTKLHTFLPWDKDGTFNHVQREVMEGIDQNVLSRRLMNIPEYKQFYLGELMRASEIMGAAGGLMEQSINRFYDQIAVDARSEPNKQCSSGGVSFTCGAAEFESAVNDIRAFAQSRSMQVVSMVYAQGYAPPATIEEVPAGASVR